MYRRILVAIDDSPTAAKALDEAIRLAAALDDQLCIAYAADEAPLVQHGMGLGSYIDVDKVKLEIREMGNRLPAKAVRQAQAAGCKAEPMLIEASRRRVAEMIADAALLWRADLIVIGAYGQRGIERMLMGSVAENLTRISAVSLLLVRPG